VSLLSPIYAGGKAPFVSANILSRPLSGFSIIHGGKWLFLEDLEKQLVERGGNFLRNHSIKQLHLGKQISITVQVNGQDVDYSGRFLIISTKWTRLKEFSHDEKISKWVARHAKLRGEVFYPFTLHLGISENGISEKMAASLVIVDSENMDSSAGCPYIFLETSVPGDLTHAPHGKRTLTATVFLNESPNELADEVLGNISANILERLKGFLPFLEENIEKMDFEWSTTVSRKYQNKIGRKFSRNVSFAVGSMGCTSPHHNSMPKKNVIMTGGDLSPGLGFEGEIFSGIEAAHRISGGNRDDR
jgi:phytoene dehydrogenase-like protein